MFHLKIALSTGMLVAFSLGCLSAQVVEFDTSYIKLEIILDKNVLRFPEPVFGLVKITNTSNKREFFPAGLIEIYPHAIDGKNVELRSVLLNPPRLAKVEAGYSETKAFRYLIADKKQIRAILVDKSPLTFTFRTHGKPKNFPIEKLRYPDGIDYTEAGDFENLDSLPVTVHYSLEHLVFKDRIVGAFDNRYNENFALKALDPTSWPRLNPHTLKEAISSSPNKYLLSSNYLGWDDEFLFDHVPVVRLFPRQIRTLQTVIRCDTATWRSLEVARIEQFNRSRPESPETRLRAQEDFVKVLRCMGRAEAYVHYTSAPSPDYFRKDEIVIDGKTRNLDEYIAERELIVEVPGLYERVENPEFTKTNRDAQGREEQRTVHRYIWKSLINDTTLPSPREATIKRWIDGGKQGPNPCPCWNEEDDAEVQILVPVPDDGKKNDVNP